MHDLVNRRLGLALPFTILAKGDTVWLIAGEDFRYTLSGPALGTWLPGLLRTLNGRLVADLLTDFPAEQRATAAECLERLYGERVLIDVPAEQAHRPAAHRLQLEGTGPLLAHLAEAQDPYLPVLRVYCQDRLDYGSALQFNRDCRRGTTPWLWITTGPMSRGLVSPVFLPDAGPCLECLVRHFQRLSPVPELYDALIRHQEQGGSVEPTQFPAEGIALLVALVRWKRLLLAEPLTPAAVYRLHVLEGATLEVTTHSVLTDPYCPECGCP